jgi:peptidoglycan lytic transglycosylase
MRPIRWILPIALVLFAGCATTGGPKPSTEPPPVTGTASFYAHKFHGHKTASGEIYDENDLTAAHRTLPFGTRVRVTNMKNDRSVVVTVNDRGPHNRHRVIDVSRRAADLLGFVSTGTTHVRLEVVEDP